MWISVVRLALVVGALLIAASANAQTIDPVFGRLDAQTVTRMQAGLTAANTRIPQWTGAHAPGRLVASRPSGPARITAEELEAARRFILAGRGQNLEAAFATLRSGRVPLGRVENALDWISLAIIDKRLTDAERGLGSTHRTRLQDSRRQLEAFVQGRGGSMADLHRLAAMMAPRQSDFERIKDLRATRSRTYASPGQIRVELPTGGR